MTSKEPYISTAHLQRATIELHRLLQLSHGCSVVPLLVENLSALQPRLRLHRQRMHIFSATYTFQTTIQGCCTRSGIYSKRSRSMCLKCWDRAIQPSGFICYRAQRRCRVSKFHRFQFLQHPEIARDVSLYEALDTLKRWDLFILHDCSSSRGPQTSYLAEIVSQAFSMHSLAALLHPSPLDMRLSLPCGSFQLHCTHIVSCPSSQLAPNVHLLYICLFTYARLHTRWQRFRGFQVDHYSTLGSVHAGPTPGGQAPQR